MGGNGDLEGAEQREQSRALLTQRRGVDMGSSSATQGSASREGARAVRRPECPLGTWGSGHQWKRDGARPAVALRGGQAGEGLGALNLGATQGFVFHPKSLPQGLWVRRPTLGSFPSSIHSRW